MTKKPLWIVIGFLAVVGVVMLFASRGPVQRPPSTTVASPIPVASSNPSAAPDRQIPTATPLNTPAPPAGQPTATNNATAPSKAALPSASAVQAGAISASRVFAETASSQATMIDLDVTRRSIRDYRTLMGENPVGTNAEIMKALQGGNPRQATLGPAEGQRLNAKGELIDQWGTPYFFHQLSGTQMEIHSAGPDKIMGTADDLVLK